MLRTRVLSAIVLIPLVAGVVYAGGWVLAGIAVALGVVFWTLRGLWRTSPRRLLSGVGAAAGVRSRGGRRQASLSYTLSARYWPRL